MNVISIDFSKTSTGIFMRIDNKESSQTIHNDVNTSQQAAIEKIYTIIRILLTKNKFHFGLIENYGYNPKQMKTFILMCEISGVIRLAFKQCETPLIAIRPMTWKSQTIGTKINYKKKDPDKYIQLVGEKYGKFFANTDEADAYLIYMAAREIAKNDKLVSKSVQSIKKQIMAVAYR